MADGIISEENIQHEIENELDEFEEFDPFGGRDWLAQKRKKLKLKNQAAINNFLGNQRYIFKQGELPFYYRDLLAWAVNRYLQSNNWEIAATLSYRDPEPVYLVTDTGSEKNNLLFDGQLLINRGDERYALTIDIFKRSSIHLEGPEDKEGSMEKLIQDVLEIARKDNFYRGRHLEFKDRIRFLNVRDKNWDEIILDEKIKKELKANTIDFLKQSAHWTQFGIPLKRGVLLAGEPGTGKTIICKALMGASEGITCIASSAYDICEDEYISALYEMAQDLSPSIVFIEDIDFIGQNRAEFGYEKGPVLLTLLNVLDGIEDRKNIVTVATTNNLDMLDQALSKRPSRFDRIIKLSPPSVRERREIIRHLCLKIPLNHEFQEYLAVHSEGCTPAQIQEIIYGMVIQNSGDRDGYGFKPEEIDYAISRFENKSRNRIGFCTSDTKPDQKK